MFLKTASLAIAVYALFTAIRRALPQTRTVCLTSDSKPILDKLFKMGVPTIPGVNIHRLASDHGEMKPEDLRAMGYNFRIPFKDPVCHEVLVFIDGTTLINGRNPLNHYNAQLGNIYFLDFPKSKIVVFGVQCKDIVERWPDMSDYSVDRLIHHCEETEGFRASYFEYAMIHTAPAYIKPFMYNIVDWQQLNWEPIFKLV
jgi:hypothetical protein